MTRDSIEKALAAVAPAAAEGDAWITALAPPMEKYGISADRHRVAMFIGQVAEESGFHPIEEDLRYHSALRLCEVWPRHFPIATYALPYVNAPEKLANKVYANRLGNGDEASGDGWRFRGAGLIQLTGRTLFTRFGATVGKSAEDAAAWCLTKEGAAESACWYWHDNDLNPLCDAWLITRVTERINGGLTNINARVRLCMKALAALAPAPTPAEAVPTA